MGGRQTKLAEATAQRHEATFAGSRLTVDS
jgi:hypothetical protein